MPWGNLQSGSYKACTRVILIICAVILPTARSDLKCDLSWKSAGFGNYPEKAIFVQNQIIARVYVDSKWLLGSLDPEKGKAFVIDNRQINSFSTYQVLTNPQNCILNWTQSCNGVLPTHAYAVDQLNPLINIGKFVLNGWESIGRIQAGDILFIQKQSTKSDPCYNTLVSIYPKLTAQFSEFSFDLDHVQIRDNSYVELVGRQGLMHTINDVELTTNVRHSRKFQEIYILEEQSKFAEIGYLELNMDLWFGEAVVQDEHQILAENQNRIIVTKNREIIVSRNILLNQMTDLQICSTMDVLNGFPISYSSIARFSLPGMRFDQVLHVLQATDRTSILESDETSVFVRIEGSLSGKYVIATSSVTGAIDKAGLCTSILSSKNIEEI